MHLILVAAMACQYSSSECETAREDLDFTRAVEESIAREPRTIPPEPFKSLIAATGQSDYRTRQSASVALEAASMTDRRWLFWGRRHPDLEVRVRCNAILRRLNPCMTCKGSGNSKNWEPWPCWDCQGCGTAWPYSIWD